MYAIIENLEMPVTTRGSKGNKYFTDAVKATMEILEVNGGFVVPYLDQTDEGKKLLRRALVFHGNKLGEAMDRKYAYGNLPQGIGIKRVA